MPSIADCTGPKPALPDPGPFAVVGNGVLWRGGRPVLRTPESVEELGELAERHGIAQFWIHETALPALGMPSEIDDAGPAAAHVHGFTERSGAWKSSRPGLFGRAYWWKRGADGFDLIIPAYAKDGNAFRGIRTAAELLGAVVAFDVATAGARWMGTGAITSDVLVRETLGDRLTSTQCPPPVAEKWAAELALFWHRSVPDDAARRYRYVHALDLNGSYLPAASSIELGSGTVHRVDWPGADRRPAPGLYAFDLPAWDRADPPPYVRPPHVDDDALHWCTAPTAERLIQCGREPVEAWLYERQGRYLRPWYERLRDARAALLAGPAPALEAVKQTYRAGIGRLAADEARTLSRGVEYLDDEPAFQPVWAWSVIAEARCRLQRKVAALDELPVAIHTDELYFLSSRRSPAHVAAALGLRVGDELGEWKASGTARAADAVAILSSRRLSATIVADLHDLVRS